MNRPDGGEGGIRLCLDYAKLMIDSHIMWQQIDHVLSVTKVRFGPVQGSYSLNPELDSGSGS